MNFINDVNAASKQHWVGEINNMVLMNMHFIALCEKHAIWSSNSDSTLEHQWNRMDTPWITCTLRYNISLAYFFHSLRLQYLKGEYTIQAVNYGCRFGPCRSFALLGARRKHTNMNTAMSKVKHENTPITLSNFRPARRQAKIRQCHNFVLSSWPCGAKVWHSRHFFVLIFVFSPGATRSESTTWHKSVTIVNGATSLLPVGFLWDSTEITWMVTVYQNKLPEKDWCYHDLVHASAEKITTTTNIF
jgi:hypothetical protein